MNAAIRRPLFTVALLLFVAGCQTTPPTEARRESLIDDAQAAVNRFEREDPGVRDILHRAHGYAVFPSVGKGGLIVGGAYGRGVVYEQGQMIGYADLTQATIGAQIGGATFAEIIAFQNRDALDRFRKNQLAFAADATAVALKAGASATANYENGVIVFTQPNGGLGAFAAVGGQKFTFVPGDASDTAATAGDRDDRMTDRPADRAADRPADRPVEPVRPNDRDGVRIEGEVQPRQ